MNVINIDKISCAQFMNFFVDLNGITYKNDN